MSVDDTIADIESNKKLSLKITELFLRQRTLNISLVFISQSYLKVTKTIRLNGTHWLIMKIANKKKLQQISSNHLPDIDFIDFISFHFIDYKDYTKKPYSFFVNDTTFHHIIHYELERNYYKMSISEKIKAIDNKTAQNKVQYSLDRQAAKIFCFILSKC